MPRPRQGNSTEFKAMKLLLPFLLIISTSLVFGQPLNVCSFNIQFLGHFKKRDDQALAKLVKNYDIVVIQELIAPPTSGTYPDGTTYNADAESKEFFDEMDSLGFAHHLSIEDTGTNNTIHKNTPATEWWVAFFKPSVVQFASDLPHGFLEDDRSNHDDYERVPYAFAFRTVDGDQDFVLISVHLEPDGNAAGRARREHELASIDFWVGQNDSAEKDFIILGDMNIQSRSELIDVVPCDWVTLNPHCFGTNTHPSRKPYDHVMIRPNLTTEISTQDNFDIIDLIEEMRDDWNSPEPYPGDPYKHNVFKQHYSDHQPVVFIIDDLSADDD